jgi:hypothetical protein
MKIGKIPAMLFDYLEFSALAFGGIGAGHELELGKKRYDAFDEPKKGEAPFCVWGMAYRKDDSEETDELFTLMENGIEIDDNDEAVRIINERKGKTGEALNDRVSWPEYTKELGILRGA